MKIIRFSQGNFNIPLYGMVIENNIYKIVGDPLYGWEKGEFISKLSEIKLLAPCSPGKIIAVAINYPEIEGFRKDMCEPMVFIKPHSSVANPGDSIVNPFPELPWWGEAELGVVVRNIPRNANEKQVRDGILGFTIGNDVTVENVEHRDHHLARSKCADGFCPIGPWIDTEFDSSDCVIEAVQNGEIIRRGRSSNQFWQWPKVLMWLSTWITLDPWDVVLTGNPPDTVGMRYLQDGDIYTARILGLGELTNTMKTKI